MFRHQRSVRVSVAILIGAWTLAVWACGGPSSAAVQALEADNPIRPIPDGPLGTGIVLQSLNEPPTPARVRLGRWLFFDRRLSSDATISCATCHQPEYGFAQRTPVATGVSGRKGR